MGQCCENVVGFTPVPVGIAGPLRIDGVALPIPMATTEGALVASTSRGCKALNAGGGVTTVVVQDAMTRGPALEFPNVTQCAAAKMWIDSEEGSNIMKASFNSTSRFARLQHLKANMAGRTLYVRFATQTGDAMGMNMISKGTERALETMMTDHFPEMRVASLSGNFCIDKVSNFLFFNDIAGQLSLVSLCRNPRLSTGSTVGASPLLLKLSCQAISSRRSSRLPSPRSAASMSRRIWSDRLWQGPSEVTTLTQPISLPRSSSLPGKIPLKSSKAQIA